MKKIQSPEFKNIVNFDFASLYPSFTVKLGGKKIKRKRKIKKIFNHE
jgi:DNA polymerase elongation subunit (family B)